MYTTELEMTLAEAQQEGNRFTLLLVDKLPEITRVEIFQSHSATKFY